MCGTVLPSFLGCATEMELSTLQFLVVMVLPSSLSLGLKRRSAWRQALSVLRGAVWAIWDTESGFVHHVVESVAPCRILWQKGRCCHFLFFRSSMTQVKSTMAGPTSNRPACLALRLDLHLGLGKWFPGAYKTSLLEVIWLPWSEEADWTNSVVFQI